MSLFIGLQVQGQIGLHGVAGFGIIHAGKSSVKKKDLTKGQRVQEVL